MPERLNEMVNSLIFSTSGLGLDQTVKWIRQSGMSPESAPQVLLEAVKILGGSGRREHALRLLYAVLGAAGDTKSRQEIFRLMETLACDAITRRELIIRTIQAYLAADDWTGLYEFLAKYSRKIQERVPDEICKRLIAEKADMMTKATYEYNLRLFETIDSVLYHKLIDTTGKDEFLVLPRTMENKCFLDVASFERGNIVWLMGDDPPEQKVLKVSNVLSRIKTKGHIWPAVVGIKSQLEIDALLELTKADYLDDIVGVKWPVYVIEPDICLFKAMMRQRGLDFIVRSGRVFFFVGSHVLEDLRGYLTADDQNLVPNIIIDLDISRRSMALHSAVNNEIDAISDKNKTAAEEMRD